MNPFSKIWFWLLILSIIGFILSFVFFETMGETATGNTSTPSWIWIIFILSVVLFIIAFILYSIDMNKYYCCLETAKASGELPSCPETKCPCPEMKCPEPKKPCPQPKKPCPQPKKPYPEQYVYMQPAQEQYVQEQYVYLQPQSKLQMQPTNVAPPVYQVRI